MNTLIQSHLSIVSVNNHPFQADAIQETDTTFDIPCQMVVRSIGYRSSNIDPDIPFDSQRNIVPNKHGRVIEEAAASDRQASLYCVGWIKTGPTGVIINTLSDAQETCSSILEDIGKAANGPRMSGDVGELLKSKGMLMIGGLVR